VTRGNQGRALDFLLNPSRRRAFWTDGGTSCALLGLALGSALGRLRDSGVTLARMFEKAEEQALLLRMTREAAGILGAR